MSVWLGWALAVAAVAVAYARYGWQGVLLALTAVVFWLLLQFSRSLRALRDAAGRPIGEVPNAVMLNARLRKGMRLPEILKLTRSLGRPLGTASQGVAATEAFAWADDGHDEVHVTLQGGRVQHWTLVRTADNAAAHADADADADAGTAEAGQRSQPPA